MEIGSTEWKQLIVDGARQLDIPLGLEHAEGFAVHALELKQWNRKMNLTAIKSPLDVAVKHYLDSILPAVFIKPGSSLLDIGSGGGFPGIPLKILTPSLSVTMIDATRKKVSFLNHAIRVLHLNDICAMHIRLKDVIKDRNIHQPFDVITCRAFSSLKHFAMNTLPLLKPGGVLIALKGKEADTELKQIGVKQGKASRLELTLEEGSPVSLKVTVTKWVLPYLNIKRLIVILNS
jgi:16S rRNA (guanine527-N7)-methyltransferase